MTSTTSFRNFLKELAAVWKQSLRQTRGVTLLYGILTLVFIPLILIFILAAAWQEQNVPYIASIAAGSIRILFPLIFAPLVSIFSLLYSFLLCHYMQNKRSVDLYHALPLKRESMLLGRFLASLTVHALVIAVNTVFLMGIYIGFRLHTVADAQSLPGLILQSAGIQFLMAGAITAFTFAVIVCCGTAFDSLVSVFAINLSVPILIALCFAYIAGCLPGYTSSIAGWSSQYFFLSPYIGIYFMASFDTALLWWWIVSIPLFLGAALILYHFRKSEAAETSFAFPLPKIIIRFLITLAGGMAIGSIAQALTAANYYLWFFLGSFCSHLVLEVIYDRGFKGFSKSLIAYGAAVVVSCSFFGVFALGGFGYDTAVPAADTVEWVEYAGNGTRSLTLCDASGSSYTFSSVVEDPQRLEDLQKAHTECVQNIRSQSYPYFYKNSLFGVFFNGYSTSPVSFTYHLKDGSTLRRSYGAAYSSYLSPLYDFFSSSGNPEENVYHIIPPSQIDRVVYVYYDVNKEADAQLEFPATVEQKTKILDVLSKQKNAEAMAAEVDTETTEYFGTLILYLSQKEFSLPAESPYRSLFPEDAKFHFPSYYQSISVDISTENPEMVELLKSFGWDLPK